MSKDTIARLHELLSRATPGPWEMDVYGDVIANGEDLARIATGDDHAECDAALIIEMRAALPALLQQLAARDAEIATLEQQLADAMHGDGLREVILDAIKLLNDGTSFNTKRDAADWLRDALPIATPQPQGHEAEACGLLRELIGSLSPGLPLNARARSAKRRGAAFLAANGHAP